MSANANDMSLLINKIVRRLGLIPILPNLPSEYNREAMASIIKQDTLPTFSRYYPNRMAYICNDDTTIKKDGWIYLKDDILGENKCLGISDILWTELGNNNSSLSATMANYGYPEIYEYSYYGLSSIYADYSIGNMLNSSMNSIYSNGSNIYIDTDDGNPMRFKVCGIGGKVLNLGVFTIGVFIEHKDLATISPTKMNTFEALAQADIANFLYNNLKYYDGLETIYANIDLKLSELQSEGSKRDQVIDEIKNAYVSTSNQYQPIMIVN